MRDEGESAEVPINATAKPSPIRQAQRPTPTPSTPAKTALARLGLGVTSGLAPRSTIIVFAPFTVIGLGNANSQVPWIWATATVKGNIPLPRATVG